MSKIYEGEINKHTDWGGDESTSGLPVSGEQVQKFIKDTLNSKMGLFHYDETSNRYLVFADEESRDTYLADPTAEGSSDLLLGTFDAPFNYETKIDLIDTNIYNAVQKGSKGNVISFTFNTYNKQQQPVGGLATVTYTIIRNSTKKVITETKSSGSTVTFNLDKYLDEGTNTVIIGVTDRNTFSATTVSIVYQVVDLLIEDNFNISTPYKYSDTMSVTAHVSGAGTKTIEWYIDNVKLDFVKDEDEVVSSEEYRTKYINLSSLGLGVGKHSLQVRAFSTVNSEKFYTDTLYRDFIITDNNSSNDPVIAVALTIPSSAGIITTPKIYDMEQYIPYNIRIASYAPLSNEGIKVKISVDDVDKGTITSYNETEITYTLMSETSGNKTLKLTSGNTEYSIPIVVAKTSMNIATITNGLEFVLSAVGRNNSDDNREQWNYGDYIGILKDFKWNDTSGWIDNRLVMPAGTSFSIDYRPLYINSLGESPVDTGKTIELEFSTTNVKDDDAVICDLRESNGTGLLITASKVSITSKEGVTVETQFKSGENMRVAFVINKNKDVTNKRLTFIYANGILSGAIARSQTDNYTSSKEISIKSTEKAEVVLKEIRVYNRALSSDDILNNYILYRDTVEEMTEIYDRNDIYEEGSTSTFSPDKMMSRLPVMIVTGPVDILENTNDKNEQIVVDIEYTNLQDPTRSFKLENAAMRPQGTSSMGYPKKNFRIYSKKLDQTKLYDYNGKIVKDRLYSFKDKAQPVNCWCLKADYAESSGTHNTGLAKLWNDALYNVKLKPKDEDSERNVCRTNAQIEAIANDYPYDVRTAIDGFPILLFYRKDTNSSLTFLGKYNFNNDKSTEAVFGFVGLSEEHPEGIPGFDYSRMQCWEVLNNGSDYALFKTATNFDVNWSSAYESRYPDKSNPNITDLKNFTNWMVNVTQENFKTQKWEHMDVYKMAAYYIYLMRHGGVDQFVKNAMFTSEDGQHFYYILYDNDTTHGLINTGALKVKPTDNRQTVDSVIDGKNIYVFAGHDSKLWNMLEADTEFMEIVQEVDRALYTAGISYNNVIKVLNEEQANKWVERVYNQDAQYKYIGPYNDNGTNNLFMLQGKRDLHRKWWLAKRFAIYDSEFVSGDYKAKSISFKLNGYPIPEDKSNFFSITAGYPMKYGYGINNIPRVTGIELNENESTTFGISVDSDMSSLNLGDPIYVYGAPNIKGLNLSNISNYLNIFDMSYLNDNLGSNSLTDLILGSSSTNNEQLKTISGLDVADKLEKINIQGFKALSSLDLSKHKYIKEVEASGSGITSLTLAKGSPITKISLPLTVTELVLEQLPISSSNLIFDDISTITKLDIKGCTSLGSDFKFIYDWFKDKSTASEYCTLILDNVNWNNINTAQLLSLGTLGTLKLKGRITLTEVTEEQLSKLQEVFGSDVFNKNADLYIQAPPAIYLVGPTSLTEGESGQYNCVVVGAELGSATFTITSGGNPYITLDSSTGVLTTTDGAGGGTITVQLIASTYKVNDDGSTTANPDTVKTMTTQILTKTYPSSSNTTLSGEDKLAGLNNSVTYSITHTAEYTGTFTVTWTLTGFDGYAEITSSDNKQCTVKTTAMATTVISGTIQATFKRDYDNSTLFSLSQSIQLINADIAVTDANIAKIFYDKGYCANASYITKEEAAAITEEHIQPGTSDNTTIFYNLSQNNLDFSGFQYFTGIKTIKAFMFRYIIFSKLIFPSTITTVETSGYARASWLELNEGLTTIGRDSIHCHNNNNDLFYISIPSTLINNGNYIKIQHSNYTRKCVVKGGNNLTTAPEFYFQEYSYAKNVYIESTNIRLVLAQYPYPNSYNRFTVGGDAGLPTTVTAPSGGYFEDMSTTTTAQLEEIRDNVYEITNKIYYATVIINTNISSQDPDFLVTYTNQNDEEVQATVKAGTHVLPIKFGTTVKVSAVTEIDYCTSPSDKTWNYNSTSCSNTFTMDYVEECNIYINHIDGTNYTTDAWTAGGFSNEDANGVAVVRPISGSFVISKEQASSKLAWGGYNKAIEDIVTSSSSSTAVLDNNGADNTPKIIEQLTGYTSQNITGAPAAEYCAGYTFPNGKTGYLGALGEWQAAYNNKTKVNEAMSLIGGTSLNVDSYFWSSTQYSSNYSWLLSWYYGTLNGYLKFYTYYVRAFCLLS